MWTKKSYVERYITEVIQIPVLSRASLNFIYIHPLDGHRCKLDESFCTNTVLMECPETEHPDAIQSGSA